MRTALSLAVVLMTSQMVSSQTLPAGPGADVLKARCLICHESDIITSQKLSLTGWTNSINKMVRWGTQITPDERAVLQPYLAMHFGPKPTASHSPTVASAEVGATLALSAVEGTYTRACLVCHDADIIEQQKLSKTGWTRSVEKMMRWGATVPDAEKEPLVDYLASRFGPR